MSGAFPYGVVPKMRALPARRAVVVSVLDVGTSKIACLVARLRPVRARTVGRRRIRSGCSGIITYSFLMLPE